MFSFLISTNPPGNLCKEVLLPIPLVTEAQKLYGHTASKEQDGDSNLELTDPDTLFLPEPGPQRERGAGALRTAGPARPAFLPLENILVWLSTNQRRRECEGLG